LLINTAHTLVVAFPFSAFFDFSVSVNLVQSLLTHVNDFINTRHCTGFGKLTKPVLLLNLSGST
jgi:uncharacterized protein with von Willebrand factor type A (vWA) domain